MNEIGRLLNNVFVWSLPCLFWYTFQQVANNSGWLFTQTSSKLFAEAEAMCKVKVDGDYTLLGSNVMQVFFLNFKR